MTTRSELRNFLFRSHPVPMFLCDCASMRILGANDAAIEKYGYATREFRAMSFLDLSQSAPHPSRNLMITRDTPSRSLATHVTKAGKLFAVELRVVPFQRGSRKLCLVSAEDASDWSQAQFKLVQSEQIHRSLVDECPFGICRFNLNTWRYEQANSALLKNFGYTLEEFCTADPLVFYCDPLERERYLAEVRSRGSVRDFECHFRRKDGSILRGSISAYLCTDAETGHQYIQCYVLDVTRQRELEDQLSHSHRMEAVGRLAGGVAHDFNNITQSISLSCELALQDPLVPDIESKFLDIMRQTARAAEITRQLLAFSRRQVLQPRVVNINDCIRKSLSMLTRVVGVNVAIDLKLDETADHIFIDPDQLAIVLMHLADNARTAMPKGGTLTLATNGRAPNPVPVKGHSPESCVVLTVSDTGLGMDERTLNHIFEPFFSTKQTTLTTGLGLCTVHGIIAQSKGRIECTSTPGNGATFRIFLPVANGRSASFVRTGNQQGSFHILFAEDDPVVNKHLTQALERAGCLVDAVRNGEEALAAFGHQHYHLLVTDIVMPKIGGIELTQLLRAQCPSLPVVLISGYSEEVSVLQNLSPKHTSYLQKPFAVSKLVTAIRTLLSNSPAPHPSP